MKQCFSKGVLVFLICRFAVFGESSAEYNRLLSQAQTGEADAQYALGVSLYHGYDGVFSPEAAAEWFRKAAAVWHSGAQAYLGYMEITAQGVSPNFESGLHRLHASAAQTNQVAQYFLGLCYEQGRGGLIPDRFEAMDWYMKAVKSRHIQAARRLGKLRASADASRLGTIEKAWWEIPLDDIKVLVDKGDSDAQRLMGLRYQGYGGTEVNLEKAHEWLSLSAEQGNADAHYGLAQLYSWQVNPEREKAFEHCAVAAENGCADARLTLGMFYQNGFGVQADREKALDLYVKRNPRQNKSAADMIYALVKGHVVDFPDRSWVVSSENYSPPDVQIVLLNAENEEQTVAFVEYRPSDEMVEIDGMFGRTNCLPLSAFSSSTCAAIKNKKIYETFCRDFRVQINEKRLSRDECEAAGCVSGKVGATKVSYDGYQYDFSLENAGPIDVDALEIKYRIYHRESGSKAKVFAGLSFGDRTKFDGVKHSEQVLKRCRINSGKTYVHQAEPVLLKSHDLEGGLVFSDGTPEHLESSIEGIWIRVSRKMADGTVCNWDFCKPESLSSHIEWPYFTPMM